MSIEENKDVVRIHYEEAWNQRKLSTIDETHAPNIVHHDPSNPEDFMGPEDVKQRLAEVIKAFPDIHWTIEDMIAEGDKVVVHWTMRGTHKGMFAGIPSTGKSVEIQGVQIVRLVNKQIVDDWVVRDTLGLMQQLGAIPSRQKPGK